MIVEITVVIGLILFVFYLGYFLLMTAKSRSGSLVHNLGEKNYAPFVSVVVPTYNEEDTIIHKLRNLMEQDYPSMEIIVVDGASEDNTVELIGEFVRNNNVSIKLIVQNVRSGKAASLNEGFKHCSGEILVISDADAVWEQNALKEVVSNFSDPNVGAVTGRQILLNPGMSFATRVEKTYRHFYEILRVGESVLDSTPIFHGEISCFRREIIENISEDSMADDSELAVKIRKRGFKSIYEPKAIFYEYAPPTFRSRFVQKVRRGQGLIQLFLRERGIFFNPKFGKFGMIIFPAEFFMHVISPILMVAFLIVFSCSLFLIDIYISVGLASVLIILALVLTVRKSTMWSFLPSFLNSQSILLVSLIYHILRKPQHKWKKVKQIRELWKTTARTQPQGGVD